MRVLAAKHLTKEQVRDYFCEVYDAVRGVLPEKDDDKYQRQVEKRDAMLERWEQNMEHANQTLAGIKGTAWAAYNAISQWEDHERGRFKPVAESAGRAHANLFGVSHQEKMRAFNKALALV